MIRIRLGLIVAAIGGVVWVAVSAQQPMQTRPGPGTGVMDVRVVNHPAVTAMQEGLWQVSIANSPDVRIANSPTVVVAGVPFLRRNVEYTITWSTGDQEKITVGDIGPGGWIQAQAGNRSRWINLASARAVEEAR